MNHATQSGSCVIWRCIWLPIRTRPHTISWGRLNDALSAGVTAVQLRTKRLSHRETLELGPRSPNAAAKQAHSTSSTTVWIWRSRPAPTESISALTIYHSRAIRGLTKAGGDFGGRHARNDVTKAFVDNLPQGALIADSAGRVLYANESYRDLLGLETEANVPRPTAPSPATRILPSASSAFPARHSREEPQGGIPPAAARRSRGRDRHSAALVPHLRAADAARPALWPQRRADRMAGR